MRRAGWPCRVVTEAHLDSLDVGMQAMLNRAVWMQTGVIAGTAVVGCHYLNRQAALVLASAFVRSAVRVRASVFHSSRVRRCFVGIFFRSTLRICRRGARAPEIPAPNGRACSPRSAGRRPQSARPHPREATTARSTASGRARGSMRCAAGRAGASNFRRWPRGRECRRGHAARSVRGTSRR